VLYAASAYFLLQSTGGLGIVDRAIYSDRIGVSGDKITATLNILGIIVSLFLFWSGTRGKKFARFNWALPLAAGCLLVISVLWSVDPVVTLTQGTAYAFVIIGAIGIVGALDGDEILELTAWLCGLCAFASLLQIYEFPDPPTIYDGVRGIFPQKNVLGQVMAAGVLTALHGTRIRGWPRFRNICIIALCTFTAVKSGSATSILVIAVSFPLYLLGRLYLRGGSARIASIFTCVSFLIIFMMSEFWIFDLLGRDQTLTGRTLFWPYVIDNIFKRPLLGWGFCAFWSPLNPIGVQISEAIKNPDDWYLFHISNAHNGLLEFLIEIGFLGTSFFIFLWVRNLVTAIKCMNGTAGQIGLSTVLLLLAILLVGVSEEVLLASQQIWTSLFFMMGFMCEKELWLARVARRQRAVTPDTRQRMRLSNRPHLPKGAAWP
jgi:exopolysaccharide production protein ExoQ